MKTTKFTGCCTASILYGFGESFLSEFGDMDVEKDNIRHSIRDKVDYHTMYGKAVIVATTNNEQILTNKVLKEEGFIPSPSMPKTTHPESEVILWYKQLFKKDKDGLIVPNCEI